MAGNFACQRAIKVIVPAAQASLLSEGQGGSKEPMEEVRVLQGDVLCDV